MKKFTHKMVATLATGTLVFSGLGMAPALSPVALAQEAAATAPASLVDNSQKGSLTIHKFSNASSGAAGNGAKIADTGSLGDPLQGATFRVRKVQDVNLSTNAGWEKATKIQKGTETASYGAATTKTTNASGEAVFNDLEVGLYYVEETAAPAGHTISAEPFYVSVPLTNPTDKTSWLYDVHVYPKNAPQEDVVSKTVTDNATVKAGDDIHFVVSAKLPGVEKLEVVEVTDIYPADRIANPEVVKVTLGDGTELAAGDYTLDTNTPGQAKVSINSAALPKLDALAGDNRKVDVEYKFTLSEQAGEGAIDPVTNRAMVHTKGEGQDVTPPNPEDPNDPRVIPPGDGGETKSYFGNVKVNKKDPNGGALSGVEFDLYRCGEDKAIEEGNKVLQALTTDGAGQLTINGLHVNDFVNGAAGETTPKGYCLVEVKAADGHSLLAEPAYFQVLRNGQETVELTSVDITNVEDNAGFKLPFTGGDGVTLLLIIGGLIIVIGGGYAYAVNRRKA